MLRAYPSVAPAVAPLELNPPRGYFSVVVPEETENLVLNPSPRFNLTGYTTTGGLITRDTTQQRRGVHSIKFAPAFAFDQIRYALTTTIGQDYTFSLDLYGSPGRRYTLKFAASQRSFIATGRWQRLFVTGRAIAGSTDLIFESPSTDPCWVDGWQAERKAYPTTYIDGSMLGATKTTRLDIYWTGTPYASTSKRTALTRNGGRVMRLDQFAFKLLAIIGLSAQPVVHATMPLANGGSQHQRTLFPPEQDFSISGIIEGSDTFINKNLANLNLALHNARTPDPQPVSLLFQPFDLNRAIGDEVEIRAFWNPDPGEVTTHRQQRVNLEFSMYVPYLTKAGQGAELTEQSTIAANQENVLYRSPLGVWSRLGANASPAAIQTLAIRPAGGIYAGAFSGSVGGVANFLAQWNGAAWSQVGTAAPNGAVNALAVDSQGRLYAAGAFTTVGGIAANRIARYDPATNTWSALGTGITGGLQTVFALAIAPNGDLYVGGTFTTAGGVAAANIAKYVPSTGTWSALTTGTNNSVETLVANAEGQIFVGGTFTAAGGVANTNKIARWNPVAGAWATAGGGVGTGVSVDVLEIGPDSRLYVMGDFTVIGGTMVSRAAIFNGSNYEPLGVGTNGIITAGGFDARGNLYFGGNFTQFGNGETVPDGMGRWIGGAMVPLDFDISGAASIQDVIVAPDGGLYVGGFLAGTTTTTASGITTVINRGTAPAFPTVRIQAGTTNAMKFYQFVNETTNKGLYFNYTMQPGETITMTLDPDNLSIISSFQGNIISRVGIGSHLSEMYLLPGSNTLSLFLDRTDGTATIEWPINITSIHDATWR